MWNDFPRKHEFFVLLIHLPRRCCQKFVVVVVVVASVVVVVVVAVVVKEVLIDGCSCFDLSDLLPTGC